MILSYIPRLVAQRQPSELEEIASFHDFVQRQYEIDKFDDKMIVHMDETPVFFDLFPSCTIDVKGCKSIQVR